MNWTRLESNEQWEALLAASAQRPQLVFKHSTRCSVSKVAQTRLEGSKLPENADYHFLDLIRFRDISNRIAADMNIVHESPQILIIRNGTCTFHESHLGITAKEISFELQD
jgi:bacillithiol system protein YtxJ